MTWPLCATEYQAISGDEGSNQGQETTPQIFPATSYCEVAHCCCKTDSFEQSVQLMQDTFFHLCRPSYVCTCVCVYGLWVCMCAVYVMQDPDLLILTENVTKFAPLSLVHSWTPAELCRKQHLLCEAFERGTYFFLGNASQFLAVFHTAVIYIQIHEIKMKVYENYIKTMERSLK